MVLDSMNIMVRPNNIPVAFCIFEVALSICANMGYVFEVIPPKWSFYKAYTRVRDEILISGLFQWGTYLDMGDGSEKWVSFTYEWMPVYCYLCGMVGHLEKKCQLWSGEDFVGPGLDFPDEEWLKATN